jgi:hypothetical protein
MPAPADPDVTGKIVAGWRDDARRIGAVYPPVKNISRHPAHPQREEHA